MRPSMAGDCARRVRPRTLLKIPPAYRRVPSGLRSRALTSSSASGSNQARAARIRAEADRPRRGKTKRYAVVGMRRMTWFCLILRLCRGGRPGNAKGPATRRRRGPCRAGQESSVALTVISRLPRMALEIRAALLGLLGRLLEAVLVVAGHGAVDLQGRAGDDHAAALLGVEETVEVTCRRSGGLPAWARKCENAIA